MKLIIISVIASLALMFSACSAGAQSSESPSSSGVSESSASEPASDSAPPEDEKIMVPDFSLESSEGDTVTLSDYLGKVVVLNLWASWCPPCKAEMPDFQKLYEELDSGEVVLLMINQTDGQRETQEKALGYVSENGFTFPILYDPGTVGYEIFGLTSIPATVVIDGEGYFSAGVLGMTDYDAVVEMIEEARDA